MKLVSIALILVALFVLLEVCLRLLFGFGNPLLYLPDDQIGYLLAPNQKVRRSGNRIEINQYSMRCAPISAQRPDTTLRILMIGDSIVNGGWWTDQKDILSELIANRLRGLTSSVSSVEVLNASANSWAPRNELAYLKRFGLFEAQKLVLVINTDDLFATAPTPLPVGNDRSYPDRKPPFALVEAIARFLPAPAVSEELKAVYAERGDRVGANLEAILQIRNLAQQNQVAFLLVMTPLLRETGQPGPRDYELKARQRLLDFTKSEQIEYIDFLAIFNAETPQPKTLYHDHIHLSSAGNKLLSEKIIDNFSNLHKI